MGTRMNPDVFHIGTYCLQPYARTADHIRDLAECGIDVIFALENDRDTLDLLQAHHIGAVVSGVVPGWFGGTGGNAGQLATQNPLSLYPEAAKGFQDHPAIWGIDVGDEPSSLDFPHYGRIMELVDQLFPNQFPYLNLYPSYGMLASNSPEQMEKELGTPSYETYLRTYCTQTNTTYLCFDHYAYSSSPTRLIEDLYTAAQVCRDTGHDLWVVLQVNSHLPEISQSINRLRFQAYTALAFGARCISWACYTAGWWHNQVLDQFGQKTPQYDALKQINTELRTITAHTMNYRWLDTRLKNSQDSAFSWEIFQDMQITEGSMLVSSMETKTGQSGLFLCAADDPYDENQAVSSICFRLDQPATLLVHTGAGTQPCLPNPEGWYHVTIPSCSGCLVTTA